MARYLRKTAEDVEATRFDRNPEEMLRWCRQHLDIYRLTLEGNFSIGVTVSNETVTVLNGDWLVLDQTSRRLSCWPHQRFLAHFSPLEDLARAQREIDDTADWATVTTPVGGIGGSGPDVTTLDTFNRLILDPTVYDTGLEEKVVSDVKARADQHADHGPFRRAENDTERRRALVYLYQELLDALAYEEAVGLDDRPRRTDLRRMAVDALRQLQRAKKPAE